MPRLHDLTKIRALLEADRPWSVYALGDHAPALFRDCAWFHAPPPGRALAMLYRGFSPPVLFALGEPSEWRQLLDEIAEVEHEVYLHVRPEHLPVLRERYSVPQPRPMCRMLLRPRAEGLARLAEGTVPLTGADLPAVLELYAHGAATGERPDFFTPSMVPEGVYYGPVKAIHWSPWPERTSSPLRWVSGRSATCSRGRTSAAAAWRRG